MADWQPVEGYENRYEVSRDGRVRRLGFTEIGQWPNHNGYMVVRFSGPRAQYRVHRLVAQAFIANPHSYPLDHAADAGRMQHDYWSGRRSPNALLSNQQIREIRRLYADGRLSWESLGREFGICKRSIGRIVNKESYVNV